MIVLIIFLFVGSAMSILTGRILTVTVDTNLNYLENSKTTICCLKTVKQGVLDDIDSVICFKIGDKWYTREY